MTHKSRNKEVEQEEQQPILHGSAPVQVIYADRILNAGFGPIVSRLTLGLEADPNAFSPFATLVIPTIALMEAMEAIQATVSKNDDMRTVIINGMDQVKAQLEKTK